MLELVVIGVYLLMGIMATICMIITDIEAGVFGKENRILSLFFYFGIIVLWPAYMLYASIVTIYIDATNKIRIRKDDRNARKYSYCHIFSNRLLANHICGCC